MVFVPYLVVDRWERQICDLPVLYIPEMPGSHYTFAISKFDFPKRDAVIWHYTHSKHADFQHVKIPQSTVNLDF